MEALLLPRMAAITVTCEGAGELYLTNYPWLERRAVQVVPQASEIEDFDRVRAERSTNFRIVYCGTFYNGIRDPALFLQAVAAIEQPDIEVVIAGRNPEFASLFNAHSKLHDLGVVPHQRALALAKGATVLLHMGNATDSQAPGKLYEYIGARRTILAIQNSVNDSAAGMIEQYRRGLVVPNRQSDIEGAIRRLYAVWQQGVLEGSFDLERVDEVSWARRAKQYQAILEEL